METLLSTLVKYKARTCTGDDVGKVVLIYNEAIASGTNEYVMITEMLVMNTTTGLVKTIKPRDIIEVLGPETWTLINKTE